MTNSVAMSGLLVLFSSLLQCNFSLHSLTFSVLSTMFILVWFFFFFIRNPAQFSYRFVSYFVFKWIIRVLACSFVWIYDFNVYVTATIYMADLITLRVYFISNVVVVVFIIILFYSNCVLHFLCLSLVAWHEVRRNFKMKFLRNTKEDYYKLLLFMW